MDPDIKRIDTKIVYKTRWMAVREDRVRRPNGDHGLFGVIDKPDFSLIIPFDGEKYTLVKQYRYPVDGRYWEFPQGALELSADATPEQVATAELAKETGLQAASMRKIGKLFQAYSYANQAVHIFYASGLSASDAGTASKEVEASCQSFSRIEIDTMVNNGEITDLATVAALQLLDRETP